MFSANLLRKTPCRLLESHFFLLSCTVNFSLKFWFLPPQPCESVASWVSPPCTTLGKCPQAENLSKLVGGGGGRLVNLVFPFSQKSGLWYLLPNVWQTVALYILFYFIVFEDGKGGFVWYQLLHWTRSGSSRIFFWGRVISLNWVLLLSDQLKSEKSLMVLWI